MLLSSLNLWVEKLAKGNYQSARRTQCAEESEGTAAAQLIKCILRYLTRSKYLCKIKICVFSCVKHSNGKNEPPSAAALEEEEEDDDCLLNIPPPPAALTFGLDWIPRLDWISLRH